MGSYPPPSQGPDPRRIDQGSVDPVPRRHLPAYASSPQSASRAPQRGYPADGFADAARSAAPRRSVDPSILHTTEDTRTFPCPSCGGMLRFDPDSQSLLCNSCGRTLGIAALSVPPSRVAKHGLAAAMDELARRTRQQPTGLYREIVCQSCGGRTAFTDSFTAVRCPYCATPIHRDDLQTAPTRFRIHEVLPFRISETAARAAIDKWINERSFAPKEFKNYGDQGSFAGVYLSYFSYDAHTVTHYRGQRGDDYTVTVGSGDNERTEVRTSWRRVSGVVQNGFVDVTALANMGLDLQKVQELEPWPMDQVRPYTPEFSAGCLSRTYDQDPGQTFHARVRPRMVERIESEICRDIGGDHQKVSETQIDWPVLAFSQIALPVWMLTVTYRSEPYQVFINGVTGEVQGRRPWSTIKILLLVAGIVAAFLCLYLVIRLSRY